jgi:hypothetical protein
MVTIEPATLLQVDASIIVGIFIFLTILEYTGRKPDNTLETKQKKEKFRFPSIAIIIFAAFSMCSFNRIPSFILHPYLCRVFIYYLHIFILTYQTTQEPILNLTDPIFSLNIYSNKAEG